ncbi:MAG: Inner membrane transport protein YajR, partial [Olavius algarvensis Gamma 1 endosymbiont]
ARTAHDETRAVGGRGSGGNLRATHAGPVPDPAGLRPVRPRSGRGDALADRDRRRRLRPHPGPVADPLRHAFGPHRPQARHLRRAGPVRPRQPGRGAGGRHRGRDPRACVAGQRGHCRRGHGPHRGPHQGRGPYPRHGGHRHEHRRRLCAGPGVGTGPGALARPRRYLLAHHPAGRGRYADPGPGGPHPRPVRHSPGRRAGREPARAGPEGAGTHTPGLRRADPAHADDISVSGAAPGAGGSGPGGRAPLVDLPAGAGPVHGRHGAFHHPGGGEGAPEAGLSGRGAGPGPGARRALSARRRVAVAGVSAGPLLHRLQPAGGLPALPDRQDRPRRRQGHRHGGVRDLPVCRGLLRRAPRRLGASALRVGGGLSVLRGAGGHLAPGRLAHGQSACRQQPGSAHPRRNSGGRRGPATRPAGDSGGGRGGGGSGRGARLSQGGQDSPGLGKIELYRRGL